MIMLVSYLRINSKQAIEITNSNEQYSPKFNIKVMDYPEAERNLERYICKQNCLKQTKCHCQSG